MQKIDVVIFPQNDALSHEFFRHSIPSIVLMVEYKMAVSLSHVDNRFKRNIERSFEIHQLHVN